MYLSGLSAVSVGFHRSSFTLIWVKTMSTLSHSWLMDANGCLFPTNMVIIGVDLSPLTCAVLCFKALVIGSRNLLSTPLLHVCIVDAETTPAKSCKNTGIRTRFHGLTGGYCDQLRTATSAVDMMTKLGNYGHSSATRVFENICEPNFLQGGFEGSSFIFDSFVV